jgi:hypothetical protein
MQAIFAAQKATADWVAAESAQRDYLGAEVRRRYDALWRLMEATLARDAARWTRSASYADYRRLFGHTDTLRSLAMIGFMAILEALPGLQIQPDKNVVGLLVIIARRGIRHYNWNSYKEDQPRSSQAHSDAPATPGSADAAMWPTVEYIKTFFGVLDEATHETMDTVDPKSLDAEERLIQAQHATLCWQQRWEYWRGALSPESLLIVRKRLLVEPPLPYSEIVTLLRDGWTVAAARKRFERAVEQGKRYLSEQGYLE